jgi:hypothetical protein
VQGHITQIIALTTWGNAALKNPSASKADGFYPANSTFKYCEHVVFFDLQRDGDTLNTLEYAANPTAWFKRIKQDGAQSLRLSYAPTGARQMRQALVAERMFVGFVGGGGRWLIEVRGPASSDYWEDHWKVWERDHLDQKIWRVSYDRIARGSPSTQEAPVDFNDIKARLAENLRRISAFARSQKLDYFTKTFESALSRLSSDNPYAGLYHPDIAPAHALPSAADRLLAAAQEAWVFGGMGSWNDVGFSADGHEHYEDLSEQLYRLLIEAIVSAANAS